MITLEAVDRHKSTRYRSFWHVAYAANGPNNTGIATSIPTKTLREARAEDTRLRREYEAKGWTITTRITRPANRGGGVVAA
jgi:hypothetical protein